jgi:hypothetical protein
VKIFLEDRYKDCTVPLFIVSDRSRLRYNGNVIWKSLFNVSELKRNSIDFGRLDLDLDPGGQI